MNQESNITRRLADAQERHASEHATEPAFNAAKTLFRIYTENRIGLTLLAFIVKRYFDGATITNGIGLDARTVGASENALIVEIVSSLPDALQRVVNLAGDIRFTADQISVLVTVQPVTTFEVTATPSVHDSPTINLKSKAQAHRFAGLD